MTDGDAATSSSPFKRPAGGTPLLYAHRGASLDAPENTLAAFARAFEQGADGIECDVRQCKSGELVVIHDEDLQRVAQEGARIDATPWSQLRGRELGGGQHIPLLEEVLELVLGRGLINLELKRGRGTRGATVRALLRVLQRRDPSACEAIVVSSFDAGLLAKLRARNPQLTCARLVANSKLASLRLALAQAFPKTAGLHPHHELLTSSRMAQWRRSFHFVNVWTVNNPRQLVTAADAGVDGIITDDVPSARQAFVTASIRPPPG